MDLVGVGQFEEFEVLLIFLGFNQQILAEIPFSSPFFPYSLFIYDALRLTVILKKWVDFWIL